MLRKFFSQVLAVGLALVLQAPVVLADPVVSGTTGTGYAGGMASPTLTIAFDTALVDATQILSWVFKLNWGSAPLTLDTASSTMSIGGASGIPLDAYVSSLPADVVANLNATNYSFSWLDVNFAGIDLSGGIVFTGVFNIGSGAVDGSTFDIGYSALAGPSSFTDYFDGTFEYSAVTPGQAPMQITVLATPPNQIPEPGTLSLLGLAMAGAALLAARKRRKTLD